MDESQDIEHQKTVIRDAAANFFVGGADTSVSSLNTFVLAMTCWPEIQAKAQAEIDRVLGPNVLPDFSDEDSLPYITAIVKEVLRWNTVTPMGMCQLFSSFGCDILISPIQPFLTTSPRMTSTTVTSSLEGQ